MDNFISTHQTQIAQKKMYEKKKCRNLLSEKKIVVGRVKSTLHAGKYKINTQTDISLNLTHQYKFIPVVQEQLLSVSVCTCD